MAVVVASGSATSTAANTKTASLVSGDYEFVQRGKITLIGKSSATGMNVTLSVGGISLVNDQAVPFTGTAGTIDQVANVICTQNVQGGRVNFSLRNTTAGSLTTD
jgi:hypothetical protein